MKNVTNFFDGAFKSFKEADFALLFIVAVAAFAVLYAVFITFCALKRGLRKKAKRAYLCALKLFSLLIFCVFGVRYNFVEAAFAACAFFFAGICLYAPLCLFKETEPKFSAATFDKAETGAELFPLNDSQAPVALSAVRLDHAAAIADKLLLKTLGRADRQELEKIKTALTVLKVKGALSVQEGENLNEMFNTLLKLMAKYDL